LLAAREVLGREPAQADTQRVLAEIVTDAAAQMNRAKRDAIDSQAKDGAPAPFSQALAEEQTAQRARAAGRVPASVEAMWRARDRFLAARDESVRAHATRPDANAGTLSPGVGSGSPGTGGPIAGTGPAPSADVPAPPKPAPTDAERERADRGEIVDLVRQFAEAYGRKDEARLKQIDPRFTRIEGRELIRSVTLTFSTPSITFSADRQAAVLNAIGTAAYVWSREGFPASAPVPLAWRLRRNGTGWVVMP
jgi:hypothetical protein